MMSITFLYFFIFLFSGLFISFILKDKNLHFTLTYS
jgi:hypothetical protein